MFIFLFLLTGIKPVNPEESYEKKEEEEASSSSPSQKRIKFSLVDGI